MACFIVKIRDINPGKSFLRQKPVLLAAFKVKAFLTDFQDSR